MCAGWQVRLLLLHAVVAGVAGLARVRWQSSLPDVFRVGQQGGRTQGCWCVLAGLVGLPTDVLQHRHGHTLSWVLLRQSLYSQQHQQQRFLKCFFPSAKAPLPVLFFGATSLVFRHHYLSL